MAEGRLRLLWALRETPPTSGAGPPPAAAPLWLPLSGPDSAGWVDGENGAAVPSVAAASALLAAWQPRGSAPAAADAVSRAYSPPPRLLLPHTDHSSLLRHVSFAPFVLTVFLQDAPWEWTVGGLAVPGGVQDSSQPLFCFSCHYFYFFNPNSL